MKCRELMNQDPEWISSAATALDAARVMRDRSTSFLLISDPTPRRLRGIVTDRDLAVRVCAENALSEATPLMEIATREVAICNEDDDLELAETKMAETGRHRLVVLREDGGVAGVLSLVDVLRQGTTGLAGETARSDHGVDEIELTPSTPADENAAAHQTSVMTGASRSDTMKVFPT